MYSRRESFFKASEDQGMRNERIMRTSSTPSANRAATGSAFGFACYSAGVLLNAVQGSLGAACPSSADLPYLRLFLFSGRCSILPGNRESLGVRISQSEVRLTRAVEWMETAKQRGSRALTF